MAFLDADVFRFKAFVPFFIIFFAMIKNAIEIFTRKFPRQSLIGQFVRYLFTGGIAFVLDFGLFALCLYIFELHYLLANFVGLVVGLIVNYYISVAWVFSACKRSLENKKAVEFGIFAIVGIIGVGINQLCMFLMIGCLEYQEMLSKMAAAVIVLLWNFGARKLLLFKSSADSKKEMEFVMTEGKDVL